MTAEGNSLDVSASCLAYDGLTTRKAMVSVPDGTPRYYKMILFLLTPSAARKSIDTSMFFSDREPQSLGTC